MDGIKQILVVEDEPAIQFMFSYALSNIGIVTAVYRAEEALVEIKDRPDYYSLVIADYRLPGIDGLELLEKFQEIEQQEGIKLPPRIFCTGYDDSDVLEKARNYGAAIIKKPFQFSELERICKETINNV